MRIGILGGTFDPIHRAHMAVALGVKREFALDKVLLTVAALPPHKTAEKTSAELRFLMAKEAALGIDGIEACDIELKRQGKSYTVDTLRHLSAIYAGAELFFVVGADMLKDFMFWYMPGEILKFASLIGVERGGEEDASPFAARVMEQLGGNVYISKQDEIALSSTDIRRRVFEAKPLLDDVAKGVGCLIYEHGLYMPEQILDITRRLSRELSPERFKHSVSCAYEAVELAGRYGVDPKKARIAALLHDCVRFDYEKQAALANKYGVLIPRSQALLHAGLGSLYAKHEYGVEDEEILNAIARHTTGAEAMTDLDKVVYLADKIEPQRNYGGIDELRTMAYNSLNGGVLLAMQNTIDHMKRKGHKIDAETERVRRAIQNKI